MPIPSQVANVRWNLNPPPAVGPHAYFDQWAADPHVVHAYSLRDDAQLTVLAKNYNHNLTSAAPGWVYDPLYDAGKGTIFQISPLDADIVPQLWITDITASGTLTFVWDMLVPAVWSTENAGALPTKAFQVRKVQGSSIGVWMETRLQRLLTNQLPVISCIDWRSYGVLGPGAFRGPDAAGHPCRNSDTVQPKLTDFLVHAEIWTRFVVHIELAALIDSGATYDLWSLWVGDEQRDLLPIYIQIPQEHLVTGIAGFAFEWDNSLTRHAGSSPISIYNRNFLMFRGIADPVLLLQKPIG